MHKHENITLTTIKGDGGENVKFVCECGENMKLIGKTQLENMQNALGLARKVLKGYYHGEMDEADIIDLDEVLDVCEEEGN